MKQCLVPAAAAMLLFVSPAAAQTDPADLYSAGRTWAEFFDAATGRRELWERNAERAVVPASLLERVRTAGGEWSLLAIATDRCSDSVNTIPFVAALAEALPSIELRIADPEAGRAIMEAHRTPDGRAATPTVLLLDAELREVGAWIERPAELQAWIRAHRESLGDDETYRQKMEWYDRDAGASTLEEIVSLIEAAAAARR